MPFCMFLCHAWRFEMFWVTFDFERTYIKHVWLFQFNTSIFRKLKQLMPFCSITPPDTYVIIKGCNWNGWWHSSVLWKNHPRSFHEAFLSMLTFLPWHIVKIILICENSCTINWFHKTFYLRYLTWFWICFRFCFTCSHFNPLTTWMQLVTYFNKVCSLKKHETVFWKRQNVFLCST